MKKEVKSVNTSVAQENYDVCFKSKLLNKYFDSKEDLIKAEDEYRKAHEAELKLKEERTAAVATIQDAANVYLAKVAENKKAREAMAEEENKLYAAYRSTLEDFSKKYPQGYRLVYTQNGDNVEFKVEEVKQQSIEDYFAAQRKAMQKIFDNFWF